MITTLSLIIAFLWMKKSESKQNLIGWIILSIIIYLAYNIAVCLLLGSIGIYTNLLCLSIVNVVMMVLCIIKIVRDKDRQKYFIRKRDIIAVFICIGIAGFASIKQYHPYDGTIATASVCITVRQQILQII